MNGAKGFRKALSAGGLRRFGARLRADTSGNVLAISAAALIMLLTAIGGAVDISRAYVVKTNLQAACDAGVLAGRRALSKSADYGAKEKATAKKMFDFNLHAEETDSYGVVFDSQATDTGSVTGKASATMPVTIMQIFDATDVYLGVDCSAELQMASADVMFVLDVTGSMAGTKIQGLRDAVREFHATVADAVIDKDKTVIRYGFVPYSQSVNTSGLTTSGAMDPEWFQQVQKIPTRYAVFNQRYEEYPANSDPAVSTVNETMTGITTGNCDKYGVNNYPLSGTATVKGGGPAPLATTSTTYKKVSWTKTSGSGSSAPGTCVRSKTTTTTTYGTNVLWGFSGWEYGDADVQTPGMIPGSSVTISKNFTVTTPPTKPTHYVSEQGKWDMRTVYVKFNGKSNVKLPTATTSTTSPCIEERKTVMNFAMNPIPDDAWDLNINDEPDQSDELTKWRGMWRDMYYTRTTSLLGAQAANPACPAPMRQFEEVDTTSTAVPGWLDTYLDNLVATGSTYHDIGMIWGARLASTKGMFAENVLEGDRNSVSRHIIFMTDGQMEPTNSAYSSYGIEGYEHKVAPAGSTDGGNSVLASYHNNRFLAACRRAKEEGYTVWFVGFGTAITTVMKNCSSANRAYQANNTTELKNAFRYIAGQVADLRINK